MLISEFDFDLPENLIAQEPLQKRENSRMLVLNRAEKTTTDAHFFDFTKYIKRGDIIVLNNTKVFPARLFGETETGAKVEIFLVEKNENEIWETLARPAKRLKTGKKIVFSENLTATVLDRTEEGRVVLEFSADGDFDEILDNIGKTPLPPYIRRDGDDFDKDRERYQTVFASNRGAIAAPTAGLHFTPQILDEIKNLGATVCEITLHVGYGTLNPSASKIYQSIKFCRKIMKSRLRRRKF